MAAVLRNGDYVPDGKGGFLQQEGTQGLLCEVLFRLSCRRGGFALLPELGSRLYSLAGEKPSARAMAARQYAQEALEDLNVTVEDAEVTVLADGTAKVLLNLTAAGSAASLEVTV